MNFNTLFIIYSLLSLTFISVSFMVKKKFFLVVVFFNLFFFSSSYYVTASLLGLPKPLYNVVPLFNSKNWPKEGLRLITYFVNNDKTIYFCLQGDDDIPRI